MYQSLTTLSHPQTRTQDQLQSHNQIQTRQVGTNSCCTQPCPPLTKAWDVTPFACSRGDGATPPIGTIMIAAAHAPQYASMHPSTEVGPAIAAPVTI